ncbi:MAG: AmmeMemoRadiSam system protein B [Chrysiogenales bacterium]|nr:MAG: AmmeMemoRadiSam system protein B [Chrysiogenales bacterium]
MYRRKPAVAGSFYPSNPERLGEMLDASLNEASGNVEQGDPVGVVSPHAGYVYSGPVAAYAFRRIDPGVERAVVLAPSHRVRFNGAALVPEGYYETPLGSVAIDGTVSGVLDRLDCFTVLKEAHELEHSLEVQLPFLQRVLGRFSIVPVIIGTTDLDLCREIAEGLHAALAADGAKTAVIISTDLSHYHPYDDARVMDRRFIDAVATMDEAMVKEVIASGRAEACGEGPVMAGMALCKLMGATRATVLTYANSGDTAGGRDQVVGYFAAAFEK